MHLRSTRFRYGAVAQALHWLTAVLVIAAYFIGPGGSEQRVYSPAVEIHRALPEVDADVDLEQGPRYEMLQPADSQSRPLSGNGSISSSWMSRCPMSTGSRRRGRSVSASA